MSRRLPGIVLGLAAISAGLALSVGASVHALFSDGLSFKTHVAMLAADSAHTPLSCLSSPAAGPEDALARTLLLSPAQFPAGWAPVTSGSAVAVDYYLPFPGGTGAAVGALLSNGTEAGGETTWVAATAADATNAVSLSLQLESCEEAAVNSGALDSEKVHAHGATSRQLHVAGAALGIRTTFVLDALNGGAVVSSVTVYEDTLVLVAGRYGAVLTLESAGTPPDSTLEVSLTAAALTRLTGG